MISVLLILDNYWINRYAIETMLQHSVGGDVELLIYNNGPDKAKNLAFTDWLFEATETYPHIRKVSETNSNTETISRPCIAFNTLMKAAAGEYICVFDSRSIVAKNWLYHMLYHADIIHNAGVVGIPEFSEPKSYCSLIDNNDEMINVWKSKDESIHGIMLFKKELVTEIGYFDERLNGAYFQKQYALRAAAIGKQNFYIPGQIRVNATTVYGQRHEDVQKQEVKDKEYTKMLAESIEEMRRVKNFKIEALGTNNK